MFEPRIAAFGRFCERPFARSTKGAERSDLDARTRRARRGVLFIPLSTSSRGDIRARRAGLGRDPIDERRGERIGEKATTTQPMAALESFPPGPSSTGPTWPAQMTRRLGESLFLLNNRRITSEEHASEVAQVLDRIVNSESHGAVSKILALDTLRDAGLIGDAQLAAQKSTVLARRDSSGAMNAHGSV